MTWAAGIGLAAIVALLAWSVARRRPEHRLVAGALTLGVDGRTFRQIAAEIGMSLTAVHARYTAGEARLRKILREK